MRGGGGLFFGVWLYFLSASVVLEIISRNFFL